MSSNLQNIITFSELARLIGVDKSVLYKFCYGPTSFVKHKRRPFKNRDGTYRQLDIPHSTLKMIQGRLLAELERMYEPNARAFAYIKDRGIRENAEAHVRKRVIFSVDLERFFDQINFGRVRGRLLAAPYKLSNSIATAIANLTTFQNRLPFGAPTSPILSNMICGGLDADLSKLGQDSGSFYTRYADDIVFSTQKTRIPSQIARIIEKDGAIDIVPGFDLERIIASHGFKINPEKTRLKTRSDSQIICGVVCNQKLNVRRDLLREVRALLHCWQKFGMSRVQEHWVDKYKNPKESQFEDALRGKINFISHIRGENDIVVWKMVDRFNALTTGKQIEYDLPKEMRQGLASANWRAALSRSVCVVYAQSDDMHKKDAVDRQGSGFVANDGLIITNAHVACYPEGPAVEKISARFDKIDLELELEVISCSTSLDVALLRPKDTAWQDTIKNRALTMTFDDDSNSETVTLAGYPNYREGDSVHISQGHITGTSTLNGRFNGLKIFRISQSVIYGNSGGPLLNQDGQVIGIAVCGSGTKDAPYEIHNGFIPNHITKDFFTT